MLKVKIYNLEGKETGEIELTPAIFGLRWNPDLIHQVVRAYQANKRQVLAHAKDRAEVSGGGRKPWKQKGTGRARHGSIRSPLWRGGGITFGPTKERNFKLKINKKMARAALLTVLSAKNRDSEILVLKDLKLAEAKTKQLHNILKNFPKLNSGLLVLPERDEVIERASKNLRKIKTTQAGNLNILDLLSFKYLVLPMSSVEVLNKTYAQ